MADEVLDVAIVGGGISGVYAAWRLRSSSPQAGSDLSTIAAQRPGRLPRVALFEGSGRIGGRLLSLTPPGMPHVKCEVGGMRFMSTQPLVQSLVEKLKLDRIQLPVSEGNNLAYLRGVHLRTRDLTDSAIVPYALDWAERGRDPSTLLGFAVDQLLPGTTQTPAAQLLDRLKTAEVDGRPVWQWGFWNLVARALSAEAHRLAMETSGYSLVGLNWNALDTIRLNFGDFGKSITYWRVRDGYELVPQTLCRLFQEAGGEVRMDHRLRSFDSARLPDGTDGFELRFADVDRPLLARTLVLAMPRGSLELLDKSGALLRPDNDPVWSLIRSVIAVPLLKLFLCYDQPWWEAVGVTEGQSVTDLPIRQCYYWAVEGGQRGADTTNRNAALMATYNDTIDTGFWSGLDPQSGLPRFEPRPTPHVDAKAGHDNRRWSQHAPSQAMVDEAQRQLGEMHGLRNLPSPYAAAFHDWSRPPFGGGAWFWNVNVRSWEVVARMVQPDPTLRVHVCGDAYSENQGWVEGALETAELMLQTKFGLSAPNWATES